MGNAFSRNLNNSLMLRAADRYAYTGCGSTAYCYLFYLGDEQILIHIRKPCRTSTCLVRIAGPCPAVPFQLVPVQLGLSPAGPCQLWCTNLRITTETRPTRNTYEVHAYEVYSREVHAYEVHSRKMHAHKMHA